MVTSTGRVGPSAFAPSRPRADVMASRAMARTLVTATPSPPAPTKPQSPGRPFCSHWYSGFVVTRDASVFSHTVAPSDDRTSQFGVYPDVGLRLSTRDRMSEARHALARGPICTGFGYRPDLTPAHQVLRPTG